MLYPTIRNRNLFCHLSSRNQKAVENMDSMALTFSLNKFKKMDVSINKTLFLLST